MRTWSSRINGRSSYKEFYPPVRGRFGQAPVWIALAKVCPMNAPPERVGFLLCAKQCPRGEPATAVLRSGPRRRHRAPTSGSRRSRRQTTGPWICGRRPRRRRERWRPSSLFVEWRRPVVGPQCPSEPSLPNTKRSVPVALLPFGQGAWLSSFAQDDFWAIADCLKPFFPCPSGGITPRSWPVAQGGLRRDDE